MELFHIFHNSDRCLLNISNKNFSLSCFLKYTSIPCIICNQLLHKNRSLIDIELYPNEISVTYLSEMNLNIRRTRNFIWILSYVSWNGMVETSPYRFPSCCTFFRPLCSNISIYFTSMLTFMKWTSFLFPSIMVRYEAFWEIFSASWNRILGHFYVKKRGGKWK